MIYVKILEWLIEILLMLSGFVGTGQFHCQFEPKLAEAVISGTLRQEPAESVLPGDSSEELHREEYIESVYEGWGSQVMTSVGKVVCCGSSWRSRGVAGRSSSRGRMDKAPLCSNTAV